MFADSRSTRTSVADAAETSSTSTTTQSGVECVTAGDSVVCEIEAADGSKREISPSSPRSLDALAQTSMRSTVLETALLVFPFFAWGSSMPALKLVMPHVSSPLLLGSIRLLPAGLLLIGWAAATGRKHPTTAQAWMWIVLFSLVDGAAFQVSGTLWATSQQGLSLLLAPSCQGFLAQGLTMTGAGVGSVIIDSQPLTVALLAALLFGERLGPTAVSGLLLGVVGLLLVELPPEDIQGLFLGIVDFLARGDAGSLPDFSVASFGQSGAFWMLLAAQSMAVCTVMVRCEKMNITHHQPFFSGCGDRINMPREPCPVCPQIRHQARRLGGFRTWEAPPHP